MTLLGDALFVPSRENKYVGDFESVFRVNSRGKAVVELEYRSKHQEVPDKTFKVTLSVQD